MTPHLQHETLPQDSLPREASIAVPKGRRPDAVIGIDDRPAAGRAASTGPSYGVVLTIFVAYIVFAIGLTVWRGVNFIEPDRWAIFLLIGAIVLGKWKAFLRDWVPFVFLLFGFEFLRGIAGDRVATGELSREQHSGVHVESLIAADRAFFGEIPATWLQDKLYVAGTVHWYDLLAVMVYGLHFVFPLVFAFMLWIKRKDRFWQFTIGLLVMSYLGFAGFLLYPAAPPWLAQQWGYIQDLHNPFDQAFKVLAPRRYDNFDTMTLWTLRSPNPVAAMPSLHAAYPWFVLLFAIKFYGWRGLIFFVYNAMVWFSVVYLGHHWVIDILAGMFLATVCFLTIQFAWPRLERGIVTPRSGPARRLVAKRSRLPFHRFRSS